MIDMLLKIFRRVWYIFASFILLAAILVISARALTPLLNAHKHSFEVLVGKILGTPVKIGKLHAWWQGFHPDLKLEQVSIYNPQHKLLLHIQSLQIDIDVFDSLLHRRLEPSSLEIAGAALTITQKANQKFVVNEFEGELAKKEKNVGMNNQRFLDWFLTQPSFILRNIQIKFHPYKGAAFSGLVRYLKVFNDGAKHIVLGTVSSDRPEHSVVHVGLLLNGDLSDKQKLKMSLYANLQHIDVAKLPIKFDFQKILKAGMINARLWMDWNAGTWQSIHTVFDAKNLHLILPKHRSFHAQDFSANASWEPVEHGWQFSADHLHLILHHHIWQKSKLLIRMQQRNGVALQTVWLSDMSIKHIDYLLSEFSLINKKQKSLFQHVALSGYLHKLLLVHQGPWSQFDQYYLTAKFDNLSWKHFQKIPGVEGLSGYLRLEPLKGLFYINASNMQLDFGSLFLKPLLVNKMRGFFRWKRQDDHSWLVRAYHLTALNNQLAMHGRFSLRLPADKNKSPVISLLAGFDLNDSSKVTSYLPVGILKKDVVDWLTHAFPSGKGASGTVILRGPVQAYPFDHHEGVFIVNGHVHDTELHYAPDWPNAQGLNADLLFKNRMMKCVAQSGHVYGAKVKSMEATIPVIGTSAPEILYLKGFVKSDAADLLKYLHNSVLEDYLGKDIDYLKLKGQTTVQLNEIKIPLFDPDKTTLNGQVHFSKVSLAMPLWQLHMSDLTGPLFFTENSLSSQLLTAKLLNKPAKIEIKTIHSKTQKPVTQMILRSHVAVNDVIKQFKLPKNNYLKGDTDYQALLDLASAKDGQQRCYLNISSNLKGISFKLPKPFSKTSDQLMPFNFDLNFGDGKQVVLGMDLDKHLSSLSLFKLKSSKMHWFNTYVHLGKKITQAKSDAGIYVDGYLKQFDLKFWQNYLKTLQKNVKSTHQSEFWNFFRSNLKSIDLQVGSANLFGQSLNDVGFTVKPQENAWSIGINGIRILGTLILPENLQHGTISGRFRKLYLQSVDLSPGKKINPGKIPNLNIQADNFQYGENYFGRVSVSTASYGNTMRIKRLSINSSVLNGSVSGMWRLLFTHKYFTELSGHASSNNIDSLLKSFDISSSVVATTGRANFSLTWPGAIYDPALKTMSGNISLKLGKGRIVELGSGTTAKLNLGRLLTLLDVDRIFQMNIGDLTKKGYVFDSVKGDLRLKNGLIVTNNLFFDGSVASILAKGSVNLIRKWLDLHIQVISHVTSSLPVVAAVAVNPIVGAAAWVAGKIFSKQVGKMTSYYYRVTGPWKKPIVQNLKS